LTLNVSASFPKQAKMSKFPIGPTFPLRVTALQAAQNALAGHSLPTSGVK